MKWGTYRPQVFFGMKTRSTRPMITGLMWSPAHAHYFNDNGGAGSHMSLRHTSEMDSNISYGWNQHDGRSFGRQEILDRSNQLRLMTEMLKTVVPNDRDGDSSGDSGGDIPAVSALSKGGDWNVRLTGSHLSSSSPSSREQSPHFISLFYYFAFENVDSKSENGGGDSDDDSDDSDSSIRIQGVSGSKRDGLSNPILMSGESNDLGQFFIYVKNSENVSSSGIGRSSGGSDGGDVDDDSSQKDVFTSFHFLGLKTSPKHVWKVKDHVQQVLQRDHLEKREHHMKKARTQEEFIAARSKPVYATLPNTIDEDANIIVIQKIVKTPFQIDIAFLSEEMHPDLDSFLEIQNAGDATVKQFRARMKEKQVQFTGRFDRQFSFEQFSEEQRQLAMFALSNMIGSLGYFYGDSYHKYGNNQPVVKEPYALFTGVPARSFFPRGFLWDEGFHLLLTQRWDKDISKDIIQHWLRTMSAEGWIPREQILGDEARSRVPQEFQVQHDTHANPPMIFLTIHNLMRQIQRNQQQLSDKDRETTSTDVGGVHIQLHQSESIESDKRFLREVYPLLMRHYNWIVQTQKGQKPNAYRWRGRTPGHTLASGLDDYPRGNDEPQDSERHLDLYCWVFMMSDVIQEMRSFLQIDADKSDMGSRMSAMRSAVKDLHWNQAIQWYSDYAGAPGVNETRNEFSDHIGYVSLFPFLFDLVNIESEEFGTVMDFIHNRSHLWTSYGLRSLSATDPLAGTKENYWRGPIWMNINYLTLRALYRNAVRQEPVTSEHGLKNMQRAKQVYQELRNNLIQTLTKNWRVSKTLHEQYNPVTGSGQRAFPFTGWTALITLVFGELY